MKPLQLLDRWGFCPFCVAIRNTMSSVTVQYRRTPDGGHIRLDEQAPPRIITRAVELTEWLYDHITEDFSTFILDEYRDAFVPVAVIGGVPLCPIHLWAETDPQTRRTRAGA